MKTFRIILVSTFFISHFSLLSAGWIIKERSFNSVDKTRNKYVYYIQDQKLKMVEDQLISIFDLRKETMTFIAPEKKLYWSGTPGEYKTEFKAAIREAFMKQMKDAPEAEKEMVQATFEYYLQSMDDTLEVNQTLLDMTIVNTGRKEKIAGKQSLMYGLFVNEILKEEIWISEEVPIYQEFDMVRFNAMLKQIGSDMVGELSYQASRNFAELLRKGLLMKTVDYTQEFSITTEVTKVKQARLEASAFMPPEGYQKTCLSELDLFGEN